MTQDAKEELLRAHGINWDELPMWQRRGAGWSWETYQTMGLNPQSGTVTATRRRLVLQDDLACGAQYGAWIEQITQNG